MEFMSLHTDAIRCELAYPIGVLCFQLAFFLKILTMDTLSVFIAMQDKYIISPALTTIVALLCKRRYFPA